MNEATWRRLLDRIRDGLVVPVVGPRLMLEPDGQTSLQGRVAEALLSSYDLVIEEPLPPFRELNEAVSCLLAKDKDRPKLQDLYADVDYAINKILRESNYAIPEPIRQLTEIGDFHLFVTLMPDDLIARSLRRRCAVNEIIHSPALPSSEVTDLPNNWAERLGEETHLLYLFGKSRPAPMFAIHDEDNLEYAYNVIAGISRVTTFLEALQQRYLLLIGCNFPDWLGRFFLRATSPSRLSEESTRRELLIDQLQPTESLTLFLERYSKETEILSDIPPVEFVSELHRRWKEERNLEQGRDAGRDRKQVPSGTMFFISYSRRTDLPRAESLYRALLDLGVRAGEMWFDRHTIEPGQDFRQHILDGIRSCRYFLPLLSEAANERDEAFVFEEWQAANARKKQINYDDFIIPIIVDPEFAPERYRAKPVRDGDWAQLDFGHAPEGVPDERVTAKLRKLVREARRSHEE
ncbi:MAG: toll/interleukin-1 receptor domain-containing protein [Chromatiaceae bacterium]|nr:toll/interleukin-1 receptor domain-containing protein [Chromatiaceae bacterium]